jgi:hypothetical protein
MAEHYKKWGAKIASAKNFGRIAILQLTQEGRTIEVRCITRDDDLSTATDIVEKYKDILPDGIFKDIEALWDKLYQPVPPKPIKQYKRKHQW